MDGFDWKRSKLEFKFDPRQIEFKSLNRWYMDDTFGAGGAYIEKTAYDNQAMDARPVGPMKMKQRLDLAVNKAEAQLADAKRARDLFDQHPFIEELIDLLNRGRI